MTTRAEEAYQQARPAIIDGIGKQLFARRDALVDFIGLDPRYKNLPENAPEWKSLAEEAVGRRTLNNKPLNEIPDLENPGKTLEDRIYTPEKIDIIAASMRDTVQEQEAGGSIGGATWGQIGKGFTSDPLKFIGALLTALFAWIGNGFSGFGEIFQKALGPLIAPGVAEDMGASLQQKLAAHGITGPEAAPVVHGFKNKILGESGAPLLPPLAPAVAAPVTTPATESPAPAETGKSDRSLPQDLPKIFERIVQASLPISEDKIPENMKATFAKAKEAFIAEGTKLAKDPESQKKDAGVFADEVISATKERLAKDGVIDPGKPEDPMIGFMLGRLKENIARQKNTLVAAAQGKSPVAETPVSTVTAQDNAAQQEAARTMVKEQARAQVNAMAGNMDATEIQAAITDAIHNKYPKNSDALVNSNWFTKNIPLGASAAGLLNNIVAGDSAIQRKLNPLLPTTDERQTLSQFVVKRVPDSAIAAINDAVDAGKTNIAAADFAHEAAQKFGKDLERAIKKGEIPDVWKDHVDMITADVEKQLLEKLTPEAVTIINTGLVFANGSAGDVSANRPAPSNGDLGRMPVPPQNQPVAVSADGRGHNGP